MTRSKVKLALIRNEAQRRATLKKRKRGFLKKIHELATLCGIQACAIIYSPHEADPEVWPSPNGVRQVLTRFKNMPTVDQLRKMVSQESFLRLRIQKGIERMKKQQKEIRDLEIHQVMLQGLGGMSLSHLNMADLNDLSWAIDSHFKDILKREETLLMGNPNPQFQNLVINDNVNNYIIDNNAGDAVVAAPALPMPVPIEDTVMVEVPTLAGGTGVGAGAGVREVAVPVVSEMPQPLEEALERPPGFETSNRQQWFMDMINPENHIPFGGGPVGGANDLLPFIDQSQGDFNWPSEYFP